MTAVTPEVLEGGGERVADALAAIEAEERR